MVDRARAAALIDAIRAAAADLARYAVSVDLPRLKSETDAQNMVLFAAYRAAQGCIDLAHHVIAEEGLPLPPTYRAAFQSLKDAGWIDDDLASRLGGWAGLRNVIAHAYVTVDLARVHAALAEHGDLLRFAEAVAARLT